MWVHPCACDGASSRHYRMGVILGGTIHPSIGPSPSCSRSLKKPAVYKEGRLQESESKWFVSHGAGAMLNNLLTAVPELRAFANLRLEIPFNLDSCRVGPAEWVKLAKILHRNRDAYDAFLIVHGGWPQLPHMPLGVMHAP